MENANVVAACCLLVRMVQSLAQCACGYQWESVFADALSNRGGEFRSLCVATHDKKVNEYTAIKSRFRPLSASLDVKAKTAI
jgi:hypothetical protein